MYHKELLGGNNMTFGDISTKAKSFFAKIGKRNLIIIGAVALIGVAVCLNLALFSDDDDGYTYSGGNGMENELESTKNPTSGGTQTGETALDSYFSTIQVNRQRARDEALEVLQGVVDDVSSSEEAKNNALAEITTIAKVMETESNIETLIEAKGFSECVAVINKDSASIVVKSEGLQAAQISQINEIVYEQAGISPVNVKIIQK